MDIKEQLHREKIEFPFTKQELITALKQYDPELVENDPRFTLWEQQGHFDFIDRNEVRYYSKHSVNNILRLVPEMRALKLKVDGVGFPDKTEYLKTFLPTLLERPQGAHHYKMITEVRLNKNYVSQVDWDTITCWMPYPTFDIKRQSNVICQTLSFGRMIPSSVKSKHSYLIMTSGYSAEKISKNQEAPFYSVLTSFVSHTNCHFELDKITTSNPELYAQKTQEAFDSFEGSAHVVNTGPVAEMAKKIVGAETNPYQKSKLLFDWVSDHITWAAAVNYGLMPCIPEYTLAHRHGDCGMVTLLYISMCLSVDIPARWQSGYMLHDGYENLHDWANIYLEPVGWVAVDASFGRQDWSTDPKLQYFYLGSYDGCRCIINNGISEPYLLMDYNDNRADPIDCQRGELEDKNRIYPPSAFNFDLKVARGFDVDDLDALESPEKSS